MKKPRITLYQGQDESDLIRLWNETLVQDPISVVTFRAKVLLDENFRPENLILARSGTSLIGFILWIKRRVPQLWEGLDENQAWITAFGVQKEARRQGIARRLFLEAEGELHQQGCKTISISPYTPHYFTPGVDTQAYPEAIRFLEDTGYSCLDRPISMQIDLHDFRISEQTRKLGEMLVQHSGVKIRPVQGEDMPALLAMIGQHFSAEWYRHAREYLYDLLVDGSREVNFFVAVRTGQILGYCQSKRERFGPFGVVPEMRNQGLGAVLLNQCLEAMRTDGYRSAWFMWAEAQVARLYERTGFKPVREFAIFDKAL